jgi:HlyD family secretion protein
VTSLTLTPDQQEKLDPILQQTREQMQTLRNAPEAERGERAARIREATRARIRSILTAEQQKLYDQSGEERAERAVAMPGRVYVLDAEGKPAAVSITLGISDGAATEVVRGDLTEGQEVIVGLVGAPAPGSRPPGAGGPGGGTAPRLRL